MIPSSDPMRPSSDTRKQIKLKVLKTIHFLDQASIFLCTKYISTGKYIANGQNPKAPSTPRT